MSHRVVLAAIVLSLTGTHASLAGDAKARTDVYGDALPPGALARLGTARLRHGYDIRGAVWSRDGRSVHSFGADGALMEWDAETGQEKRRAILPHGPFLFGVFSADRKTLATIGKQDIELSFRFGKVDEKTNRIVRIWDVTTGKEIRKITDSAATIGGTAIAPDGKTLATMSAGHVIHLWEIPSGKPLRQIDAKEPLINPAPLAFHPDGESLISGGYDGRLHCWDVRTGKKRWEVLVPGAEKPNGALQKRVTNLAFSPDGKHLASFNVYHGFVFVWDPANGQERRRFENQAPYSTEIAFSPDSKTLLCNDKENILCEWDLATGLERQRFRQLRQPSFSADGKSLLTTSADSILLWDVATGKERHPTRGHETPISSIVLTPDGKSVATLGSNVRMWNLATCRPRGDAFGYSRTGYIAMAPDGNTIATADYDKKVRLWNPASGREIREVAQHDIFIVGVAFRDAGALFSTGFAGPFILSDLAQGQSHTLDHIRKRFGRHVFTADRSRLLTQHFDGTLCCWEVASSKLLWETSAPERFAQALDFSPDGKWFVFAGNAEGLQNRSMTSGVHLYHSTAGKRMHEFAKGLGTFRTAIFSPNGNTIATAGDDGAIRLWERNSGQQCLQFSSHGSVAHALAFTHDGRMLISGNSDGTALVWDLLGKSEPRELDPATLESLWTDLNADAAKARDAIGALHASPKHALPFLKNKLRPAEPVAAQRLADLLAALASDRLNERAKAALELESLGNGAWHALRKATVNPSLEQRRRIDLLLAKLPATVTPDELRGLRAIEVLESIGTADAQQLLAAIAQGAPGIHMTQEAQSALDRLGMNAKPK